tara:strand:+ start:101351 stop:101566 length:216 start_codon:yes stop_codon:yes gene_type:complete
MDVFNWFIRSVSIGGVVIGITLFAVGKIWFKKQDKIKSYNKIMMYSIGILISTFLITLLLRVIYMNLEVFG